MIVPPHTTESSSWQLAFCLFGQPNLYQPGASEERPAAFSSLSPSTEEQKWIFLKQ